jgi:hypothetical protein
MHDRVGSTPDFLVKLTPSVCGWIATTGFIGVHCASAGYTSSNTTQMRTTRKTRGNEFLSRIVKDLGEMRFVERELASNWTRRGTRGGAGRQSTESIPLESESIVAAHCVTLRPPLAMAEGG